MMNKTLFFIQNNLRLSPIYFMRMLFRFIFRFATSTVLTFLLIFYNIANKIISSILIVVHYKFKLKNGRKVQII